MQHKDAFIVTHKLASQSHKLQNKLPVSGLFSTQYIYKHLP